MLDYFDLAITRRETHPLADLIALLRHQRTSYDASHLALADAPDAPLHTCDAKLVGAGTRLRCGSSPDGVDLPR